ncbi:MAG: hypothetical protein RL660_2014 [Bacteroidota bacterium]|jgi:hypothetical protein
MIEKYFTAEKNESTLFIAVGIAAIACSVYFLTKTKVPLYNGMAYPLIAIALIQIAVGASVFVRSPKDIVRVNTIVSSDKSKISTEEIPRMKTVMKNFATYRWVEIALLLMGLALFFTMQAESLAKGIGLGLAIQSALMLLLDYFAEQRGTAYLAYLQDLVK